MNIINLRN